MLHRLAACSLMLWLFSDALCCPFLQLFNYDEGIDESASVITLDNLERHIATGPSVRESMSYSV